MMWQNGIPAKAGGPVIPSRNTSRSAWESSMSSYLGAGQNPSHDTPGRLKSRGRSEEVHSDDSLPSKDLKLYQ